MQVLAFTPKVAAAGIPSGLEAVLGQDDVAELLAGSGVWRGAAAGLAHAAF